MASTPSYQYVNKAGALKTVSDKALATDIAPNSGFATINADVNSIPATSLGQNKGTFATSFAPPTSSAGLAESAIASKDAYLAGLAKESDTLKVEQDQGKTMIQKIFGKLSGAATRKADAYETQGLNDEKRAIDELTSQIEGRGRSYDKQIETLISKNPEGMLRSGIENETNRLSREKASELADLAIVLNAKTRSFDTAKGIIDQKADAETEDLKTQLDGLKFFYQENAGNLDANKRTLLAEKIDAAEKEYTIARDLRKDIGQIQLTAASNGAPVSAVRAIGAAADLEAATIAAGSWLKAPKQGTGGYDSYTDTDQRVISRAGLQGATQRAKDAFLSTPAGFQDAFIRNGTGFQYPNPTPENIVNSLAEWEAAQKAKSSGDEDLNAAIEALAGSGG